MNSSNSAISFNLIDENTYDIIDLVVNCIVIVIIATFGVVGNVFNIVVLAHHGMDNSTNITLMSLSALDLFMDMATLIQKSQCIVAAFDIPKALSVNTYYTVYVILFVICTGCISSMHIVLISIERMTAVYFPMTVSRLFSLKRTYVYIAICYLFWIITYIPFLPIFEVAERFDSKLKTIVVYSIKSDYFKKVYTELGYVNSVVIAGFRGPGFLAIILVTSLATSYKLYQASRKRSNMTSSSVKIDYKAVKMLMTVCLVYLVLGIPASVPSMFYYFDTGSLFSKDGKNTALYYVLERLKDLLYVINASVNFIIYVLMSKKFSQTCWALVGKCCPMKLSSDDLYKGSRSGTTEK